MYISGFEGEVHMYVNIYNQREGKWFVKTYYCYIKNNRFNLISNTEIFFQSRYIHECKMIHDICY